MQTEAALSAAYATKLSDEISTARALRKIFYAIALI